MILARKGPRKPEPQQTQKIHKLDTADSVVTDSLDMATRRVGKSAKDASRELSVEGVIKRWREAMERRKQARSLWDLGA